MTDEKLEKGNQLAKQIKEFEDKVFNASTGLSYPKAVSIKIHFNGGITYELDTIIKEEAIKLFKEHYEKCLSEAKSEFDKL